MKWLPGWSFPESSLEPLAKMTADFPVIGSWSLGSFQSLELALAKPDEVRALVLVASTPRFCATEGWPHGLAEANLRAMQRSLARNPRGTLENFHTLCASPATLSANELAARIEASLALGIETLAAGLQKLRETDFRERVGEIKCPVLLLHGLDDQVIPFGASIWLSSKLPRSKLVMRKGAGHDLPLRHADWIESEIKSFVRQIS